jgi:hypothetical protein
MSLSESILYVLIAVAVSVLLLLFWRRYRRRRGFPEFERQRSLLSPQQRALYQELIKLVGAYSVVLPRVNLSTLVKSPGDHPSYEDHWKRVLREWVDFVVCSPSSISPVLAIKLETRMERKRRKLGGLDVLEDTLTSARIPLLRIKSSESYDANEIMSSIKFVLVNQKRKKDEELFVTEEFSKLSSGKHLQPDSMSNFKRRTIGFVSNLKGFGRAT